MGIQQQVKAFLSSAMSQFDGETIVIGGDNVTAVISENEIAGALDAGAKKVERTLTVQFAADAYTDTIKSGESITARGETWKVSSEPGSIRRGAAAVTLTLVEPERRRAF